MTGDERRELGEVFSRLDRIEGAVSKLSEAIVGNVDGRDGLLTQFKHMAARVERLESENKALTAILNEINQERKIMRVVLSAAWGILIMILGALALRWLGLK